MNETAPDSQPPPEATWKRTHETTSLEGLPLRLTRASAVRYPAYWLAQAGGRTLRWLMRDWLLPLVILALTVVLLWLGEQIFDREPGSWLVWWKVLGIYTLVVAFLWGVRARKRVVVEEFVDYTPPARAGRGWNRGRGGLAGQGPLDPRGR